MESHFYVKSDGRSKKTQSRSMKMRACGSFGCFLVNFLKLMANSAKIRLYILETFNAVVHLEPPARRT